MKKLLIIASLCLCSLFMPTTQAFAQAQNYVVAPFKVNGSDQYKYLETSFAEMLASRLFTLGQYEQADSQDAIIKSAIPNNKADAQKLLDRSKAGFIFYGSITIMGSQASIDIISLDKNGKQVQEASTTSIDSLIASVQEVANKLKVSAFGLSSSSGQDFVLTETGRTSMFVQNTEKPQENRLKSQILDFATISMDVGDFTGNGNKDIVFADNARSIYVYEWNNGAMKPITEYKIPSSQRILLVRTIKHEDKDLILLSTFTDGQLKTTGRVLEYNGKKLVPYMKKAMPFFVNTLVSPETGETTVIGQALNTNNIFRGDVFEVEISKDGYTRGKSYDSMPRNVNLYNFTYLPDEREKDRPNLITLTGVETLQVTSPQFGTIYNSDETYAGGNAFLRTSNGALVGSTVAEIINYFFIPMRMIPLDLDNDNKYELIVNKPYSTRAKIFNNYRNYPECEIQALYWDTTSLKLGWKTELIEGTVADFQVDDIDNNGVLDLVICVVSYPGMLGFGDKKTMVTLYPLDQIGQ